MKDPPFSSYLFILLVCKTVKILNFHTLSSDILDQRDDDSDDGAGPDPVAALDLQQLGQRKLLLRH